MISTERGQELYCRARTLIPGGAQLLSKRPEMFLPGGWPSYYTSAKGAEVVDLDGNRFLDFSLNGVGSCALGHADPDVDAAVCKAIQSGSMSTLNAPEEVELAELLLELHPWAEQVRYTRTGGEAMTVAVRIARAATGRDEIAFCGYHGWHDWYLSANLSGDALGGGHLLPGLDPNGVPSVLAHGVHPFNYNCIGGLEAIVRENGSKLAAIVMEPQRATVPKPGFLEAVRELADQCGAVLIFDEATIGFRMNVGGIHLLQPVRPDIAVFAKALSNGYPMAAIIGIASVMEAAQSSFISSTFWSERIGPVAAIATLQKYRRENVPCRLIDFGERVQALWREAASAHKLPLVVSGVPPLSVFRFDVEDPLALRTLFTQEMLERGFLASSACYVTFAHSDLHFQQYANAVHNVFGLLREALCTDSVRQRLRGDVAHSDFRRLA